MRNVFDQYGQPENKLTHALVTTLARDRRLLRPFLHWLGLINVPAAKTLALCEQQVPGMPQIELDEGESQGLPDAFVFNADGWAVVFECKVQASISMGQIERHRKTAVRYGFETPHMVVVAVNAPKGKLPDDIIVITWKDIYRWFNRRGSDSFWARELVGYMQIFERKMLGQDYDIRGTITMFDGLRFDAENPYTSREGRRLIRLLGHQLQSRKDLHKIGVDPKGSRRSAITGRGTEGVWDFLPLVVARDAKEFTHFPHLSFGLSQLWAVAAVTVPNGVKGGFRTRLRECGAERFVELITGLEKRLRPIIRRSRGSKPSIYVTQRHFKSQRSSPIVDARLEADLRTAVPGVQQGVRFQPQWLCAIYDMLVNKKSNMQMGIEVRLSYDCAIVRSAKAEDLFADSWKALASLVSFALQED